MTSREEHAENILQQRRLVCEKFIQNTIDKIVPELVRVSSQLIVDDVYPESVLNVWSRNNDPALNFLNLPYSYCQEHETFHNRCINNLD